MNAFAALLLATALSTTSAQVLAELAPPSPAAPATAAPAPAAPMSAADEAIHTELRGLLSTVASAINDTQYERLTPILSDQAHVVLINQDVISRKDQIKPYLDKWFGSGGFLKSLRVKLEADVLTELSADRSWGMGYGTGVETYTLADGRTFDMPTRWTAVVQKEADGVWRIRAIHQGTNFMDNPVMDGVVGKTSQWLGLGAAGGLVLGVLFTWLLMRRKHKAQISR